MRHAEGRLKAELQTIIGCFLAVSAVCACVARPVAAQGTTAAQAEPLTLTTENTVILDRSVYAGRFLQFYLIKFFVGEKEAAPYAVNEKSDRAGSRHFPLIAEDGKKPIPDGRNVIAVGDTRFLPPEERERLASNPGAILLRRVGKAVVVAGSPFNDGWGAPVKAMATFLDRVAGIRFYAPGDLWVSRPQRGSMTVATLDFFQPQLFVTSNLSAYIERNAEWLRMNPNANRMTLIANHNLANMFPPQKYGKTHPEIYEMRGGKRVVPAYLDGGAAWNPCLSAEALPELAMSHVRGVMQKKLPPRSVSFGVMDCAFDCECPACQESVKRHNGSYSHLYYTFMNKVARMCQQEFPELYLTTLGYSNVRTPPVGMKVAPNIAIKVVTKTYRLVEPAWAQAEKARIKAFSDLGGKWWIHDWCFSGVSPRSYLRQYGAFLQWGHQNGMLGAYIEWTPGESWYLDGAKYWILMQLMSDPYQDVDLLWKRHCEDMYGTASETMYRFFAHFADRYVYAPNHIGLDDLPRQEPAMHTAEDLAYQRSLLEKAAGLTKDDSLAQQRLACVMRYFRAHELFAQATAEPHRLDFTFKGAALEGFTERDTLLDSKHKTSGRLLRVGDELLIALTCRQVGDIWANTPKEAETGTRIWRESGVEVFFGPLAQAEEAKPPYAQYVINALGAFRGFGDAKDNREGVRVAVKLDKANGLYTLEAALPLKAKGYDCTAEKALSFNVARNVFTRDSYSPEVTLGWYPIFYTPTRPESRGLAVVQSDGKAE